MKTKLSSNSPIGVFDSGLGGLTVLKSLKKILPRESFIYFGDTAHVPYGTKSTNAVVKYSQSILNFFSNYHIKAVVIACNTASAVAYDVLQKESSFPLFDVVSTSVEYTLKQSQTKSIGVIGTTSTISSKAYSQKFKEINDKISVYEVSCPLFVPIIEEGWSDTIIAKEIAGIYLQSFEDKNIDSLILGCTHYPLMATTIHSVISNNIKMIFSGEAVGLKLSAYLKEKGLMNTSSLEGNIDFYVSDFPKKFDELGSQFFGKVLNNVKHIFLQ